MGYIPTMPYARFIPAVVFVFLSPLVCHAQAEGPPQAPAQAPVAAPAPEGPTMAENQLDAATIKVRLMTKIAASIVQENEILNQKFKLEGKYYKDFSKPNDFKIRLQLQLVGLGDAGSTMLQVCDGQTLWDFQKVLKMQIFRKKDIQPIMKELEASNLDIYFKSLVISNLGFGGPEAMMMGLRKAVKFETVKPDKLDGIDVWVLSGTWIDRSKLLGMNERPLPPTANLPPYVPSSVQVYIGQVNGWPYKIVMKGSKPSPIFEEKDTRAIDPVSGRPVGVKRAPPKVDPTDITLLYKLLPTDDMTPGLFAFQTPADVSPSSVKDETEDFLNQLRLLIQSETARKKAEAAKAPDDPTLKAKIEIPLPGTDNSAPDSFPTPGKTPPK